MSLTLFFLIRHSLKLWELMISLCVCHFHLRFFELICLNHMLQIPLIPMHLLLYPVWLIAIGQQYYRSQWNCGKIKSNLNSPMLPVFMTYFLLLLLLFLVQLSNVFAHIEIGSFHRFSLCSCVSVAISAKFIEYPKFMEIDNPKLCNLTGMSLSFCLCMFLYVGDLSICFRISTFES